MLLKTENYLIKIFLANELEANDEAFKKHTRFQRIHVTMLESDGTDKKNMRLLLEMLFQLRQKTLR